MALQAEYSAFQDFQEAPSIDSAIECILRPLRHVPPAERADIPCSFLSENKKNQGTWLPKQLVPLEAPAIIADGKNPFDPEVQAEVDANNKKDDVKIVCQTLIDATVYSIPGVVGGFAVIDSLVADKKQDEASYV